jgi:hypothetical protein
MDEAKNIPIIIITGGKPELYKERALAPGRSAFSTNRLNMRN